MENVMQFNVLLILLFSLVLSACQTTQSSVTAETQSKLPAQIRSSPLLNAYDFHIIDPQSQNRLTIPQLAQQLADFDVIFIGEFHGNHASHLLETQLLTALWQNHPEQVITMEMFNRDQQSSLNRYLDSEIGEVYFTKNTPTWQNYVAGYRPIIEFAKQNFIPVIAANAAADTVRCIGREGKTYIDKLKADQKAHLAEQPFMDNADYRKKYMDFLEEARKIPEEAKEKSYLAQLSRDNTMAESIYIAYMENPQAQIIHFNGSFHSEDHLGTVSALKARQSNLNIAVITPVAIEDPSQPSVSDKELKSGDYIYLLQSQPEQYQDASYRQKSHQAMFKRASEATCNP